MVRLRINLDALAPDYTKDLEEVFAEISIIFADAAARVAALPAVHEWDAGARDRVATSLRIASSRRHGRRADA